MYGGGMDMSMFGAEGETLVLNANHPLVTYITEHEDDANTEMICEQLYDLAKLQNAPLSPEAMTKFVARSNDIKMCIRDRGNIVKNPRIWIPPTLAAAITGPIATCLFRLQMNGPAVSSGMGTCGLVGQIGVYTGWLEEIAAGSRSQITAFDWIGMILICFVLPAVLSLVFGQILRKIGWIKEDDLKL